MSCSVTGISASLDPVWLYARSGRITARVDGIVHSTAAPPRSSQAECAARWTSLLAPATGDLRKELQIELSEYFGVPIGEIEARMADATARFTEEWRDRVVD